LSGFFALNNYALRHPSRRELEAAMTGKKRRFDALVEHLSDLQMVCALLRSVFNLLLLVALLALFERPASAMGHAVAAVALAAAVITVLGVAVPHAWANYAGVSVLARTSAVLLALRWVLWPVLLVMRAFDVPIRRLSGIPEPPEADNGTASGEPSAKEVAIKAEILHVASEGHAEGAVDPEEMEMIESVIEFGDQRAGEVMTPRTDIVALPAAAGGEEVRRVLVSAGHSRIPIHDGDIDNIIGVLHVKDLLQAEDPDHVDLRRLMRKPLFVPETKRLDDLLREFKARKVHMAIVLDEYGGTAGLVTVEDLIEEIVGDISDEYDRPESALMKRLDERSAEVDGRMYVDDLNDAMSLELPEDEDYDTVAGLVFSELGYIPPVGEKLSAYGATFTVLAADDRKIIRLRVDVPAADERSAGRSPEARGSRHP